MPESQFVISQATAFTYKNRLIVHGWSDTPIDRISIDLDGSTLRGIELDIPRQDLRKNGIGMNFHPGWKLSLEDLDPDLVRHGKSVRADVKFKGGRSATFQRSLSVIDDGSIVKLLGSRYTIVDGYEHVLADDALEEIKSLEPQITMKRTGIAEADFYKFYHQADYEGRYAAYAKVYSGDILLRKALEHYIGFQMVPGKSGRVYIDVAAQTSPAAEIMRDHLGVADAYSQDLNYEAGINGHKIGSNANAIPMKSGSVTGIYAHNSWEHFEAWSDIEFLLEASRLLAPGGRVVVLPLEFATKTTVVTSPSVWARKYINARATPAFDPRAQVVLDDSIQQRQIKLYSVKDFLADLAVVPDIDWFIHRIVGYPASLPVPKLALVGHKRARKS